MDPVANKPSRSFALFEMLAEELALKLEAVPTPQASKLALDARDLASSFKDWKENAPQDEDRVSLIQKLLDFSREANEYLISLPKT